MPQVALHHDCFDVQMQNSSETPTNVYDLADRLLELARALVGKAVRSALPTACAKSLALMERRATASERTARWSVRDAGPGRPTGRAPAQRPWRFLASGRSRSSARIWSAGKAGGRTSRTKREPPSDVAMGKRPCGARSRRRWRPAIAAVRRPIRSLHQIAPFGESYTRARRRTLRGEPRLRPMKRRSGPLRGLLRGPAWPTPRIPAREEEAQYSLWIAHAVEPDRTGGAGGRRALKRRPVAGRVSSETRLREALSEVSFALMRNSAHSPNPQSLQWGQTPVLTSPPVPPARDIENSSGS